eukprot:TRINITY_DN13701_c0_g1_i5.p1 TRINITY_DN13701_c0_g1~~TRINITY_DN13701_c0_g1_i5.p1  ORF type:complete len:156 (-),score=0.47 TRINITY_DN13701_c0_g1_i5:15-482(-)
MTFPQRRATHHRGRLTVVTSWLQRRDTSVILTDTSQVGVQRVERRCSQLERCGLLQATITRVRPPKRATQDRDRATVSTPWLVRTSRLDVLLLPPLVHHLSCACFAVRRQQFAVHVDLRTAGGCLLYTSDAADEEDSVDLGGLRGIKKHKDHPQG